MAEVIHIEQPGTTEYWHLTRQAVAKIRIGRKLVRQALISGLEKWLSDNCRDLVMRCDGDFWFMDHDDAMAFKLVWGGK